MSAARQVLVSAVVDFARDALDCLDMSCRQGVELTDVLRAALDALDAHDKEQEVMRLSQLVQQEEPNHEQMHVLSPEHAGADYVEPTELRLRVLRAKANEAIRNTKPEGPVIVHVGGEMLSLVKRLAEQCQQMTWAAKIVPINNLKDQDPLPTGAVLMLTRPAPAEDSQANG